MERQIKMGQVKKPSDAKRRQILDTNHKWRGNFYEFGEGYNAIVSLDEDGQIKRFYPEDSLGEELSNIKILDEVRELSVGGELSSEDELVRQSVMIMDAKVKSSIAHDGQVDKAGRPYLEHLRQVAGKGENYLEIVVGWLHDIIEDTECTYKEIEREFGSTVAQAVDCLTRKPGMSVEDYLEAVKANFLATRVKINDLKHNMDLSRLSEVSEKDLKRNEKYSLMLVKLEENLSNF